MNSLFLAAHCSFAFAGKCLYDCLASSLMKTAFISTVFVARAILIPDY